MDSNQIEAILEQEVRPMLSSHGGDVKLVSVNGNTVQLELFGACVGCPSADLGTRQFIQETLLQVFPQLEGVELVSTVSPDLLAQARAILHGDFPQESHTV